MKTPGFSEMQSVFARPRRSGVREHEILRMAAKISSIEVPDLQSDARGEVLNWLQNQFPCLPLPAEAWTGTSFESLIGGRNRFGIRFKDDVSDIWAIRAERPDDSVPGRSWITEVV